MNHSAQIAGDVDPITLEVIRNKLEGIANEMEWTLLNSSFSAIVKEGMDATASLFTAEGINLAQAHANPSHLGSLMPCVTNILKTFPVERMEEGDVYFMNDPYAGGTHIPDIAVVMPVFSEGQAIALTATMSHHQDLGGITAGSLPINSTEIYQEGVIIPALRLVHAGRYDASLLNLIKANVRIPDIFVGDLNAQIASCRTGARRLADMSERYTPAALKSVFNALIDRSELLTRRSLLTLPRGTFRAVDQIDNDGIDLDRRVRIEVAVTIGEGTIHFDLTGTGQQVRGPFNCSPSAVTAALYYVVRALTDASIPTNGGCFRPVSMHLPPGTLVNPVKPAALNARASPIKVIANTAIAAMASAIPERICANNGCQHIIVFAGKERDGGPFVVGETVASGTGAHAEGDGVDVMEADVSNGMNMPVEAMELYFPLRMLRAELRPDSGGPGRHRGGLGTIREYLALQNGVALTHRGQHHYSPPHGIAGGGDGAMSVSQVIRSDGRVEVVPSKMMTVLNKGDRLLLQTPGGGGYGSAGERSTERIERDLADGKITEAVAKGVYGKT
jgi:N-methylhydantoinase B